MPCRRLLTDLVKTVAILAQGNGSSGSSPPRLCSCRVVPAGGVAGPTSSDLWCAPSACLHLLQLFWVAAGKCWHVVSWAPRLRTSGALPRPARTSLQRPAMAPSPGASWLWLAHLVALLALRGLPSAGLLCPSFTPDADKHRAPGLLSQLPGPANRQQRKRLTPALLVAWATCPAPLATWGRALPTPSWRRHRAAWVPRRPPHRRVQRLRRRCGFAGCRVGEASNPGPPSPGTPLGGERQPMAVDASGSSGRERSPPPGQRSPDRVFCPVPGCPASMPGSRGWTSHAAMRPHLEDHAAGTLDGDVPQAYRARQHLDLCSVCGGLVSSRYNGAHPRCRPAARRAAAAAPAAAALAVAGPSLETACAANTPVLRHVPKAARAVWAQCLSRALAQVASTNSLQAWRDLFMLPKAVLRPAPRGGRRHRLQAAQFTQRRCARWLAGEREELWDAMPATRRKRPEEMDDEEARSARQSRCCSLAAEGELSRACAALTSPPLLNNTGAVAAKLQEKHPRAAPARPALWPLVCQP